MTPKSATEQADEWASENTFTDSRFTAKQAFLAGHSTGLKLAGELANALRILLADSQHSDHKCGDKRCPVDFAREAYLKYKEAQGE